MNTVGRTRDSAGIGRITRKLWRSPVAWIGLMAVTRSLSDDT